MKVKKLLTLVLTAALLVGALALPAGAAGFTDIPDPAVAQAAELLRLLGVVSGDGAGQFYPSGNLKRSEFCKMAIEIRGEGDKAAAQMTRTIFTDVKGGHWARGYINYAATIVVGGSGASAERLVTGVGGYFYPENKITCAEAVTMAMRLLGYTAADMPTGFQWYDGYMNTAGEIGLLDGLTLTPTAPITRGQTAVLFKNLLFSCPKGSAQSYMAALGCTVTEPAILLSVNATAADGTPGAVKTTAGTYKTDHAPFDAVLEGQRVKLMLSPEGKVLSMDAVESLISRTVTVSVAEPDFVVDETGRRVDIPASAPVYEGAEAAVYGQLSATLTAGDKLTLFHTASGKLEYIKLVRSGTPVSGSGYRTVTVAQAEAAYILTDSGERVSLPPDTVVYTNGERTTYRAVCLDLRAGSTLLLRYSAAGKLEYAFLTMAASGPAESADTITIVGAEPAYVVTDSGRRVDVAADAVVHDGETVTTYALARADLAANDQLTFCYSASGKLKYIEITHAASPTGEGSYRTVTVAEAEAACVITDKGEKVELAAGSVVYDGGEKTTYGAAYLDIRPGSTLLLRYSAAGKLEYAFLTRAAAPGQADASQTVTIIGAEPAYVISDSGRRVDVAADTVIHDGDTVTTYALARADLAANDRLTFCYAPTGKLKYIEVTHPAAPTGEGSYRTVTVTEAEAAYVLTDAGERVSLARNAVVYDGSVKTTYGAVYLDIRPGSKLLLHYNAAGKLEYAFLTRVGRAEDALVIKSTADSQPFAALVGSDTGYTILKNGLAASLGDLRQYDVATYDKTAKTLSLCDQRLTGVYYSAAPSPKSPTSVNVLGVDFPVLPSAVEDLSAFKVGDVITLLLTADGQVAGAVTPETAKSTAVGIVTQCSASQATVESLTLKKPDGTPLEFKGAVQYTDYSAARMVGAVVTVSAGKQDRLSLSVIDGAEVKGDLDVKARKLGKAALAPNVRLYERVGLSAPQPIRWSQITIDKVPAARIAYAHVDYAGRVDLLILDSVTGDTFTYGFAAVSDVATDFFGGSAVTNTCVTVGATGPLVKGSAAIKTGDAVGIAKSLELVGSANRLASWLPLKSGKVSRTAFALTDREDDAAPLGTVTTPEAVLPIAADVKCYHAGTLEPFASLEEARAYSSTLTVYYDRTPETGGKVRIIIAE